MGKGLYERWYSHTQQLVAFTVLFQRFNGDERFRESRVHGTVDEAKYSKTAHI